MEPWLGPSPPDPTACPLFYSLHCGRNRLSSGLSQIREESSLCVLDSVGAPKRWRSGRCVDSGLGPSTLREETPCRSMAVVWRYPCLLPLSRTAMGQPCPRYPRCRPPRCAPPCAPWPPPGPPAHSQAGRRPPHPGDGSARPPPAPKPGQRMKAGREGNSFCTFFPTPALSSCVP